MTVAGEFGTVEYEGFPPAAQIAAAGAIHYTAGDPDLIAETLAGLPPDELAEVARYAIAMAGETALLLVGAEAAAAFFRSSMRAFVLGEVDG